MPWSQQSVVLVLGTLEWGGALRLPEAWQVAWTADFRYTQRALEAGARPVRLSFTGSSNHLHQTLLRLSGSQRALPRQQQQQHACTVRNRLTGPAAHLRGPEALSTGPGHLCFNRPRALLSWRTTACGQLANRSVHQIFQVCLFAKDLS